MLDILGFFKKKQNQIVEQEQMIGAAPAEAKVKIDKNVAIHVMPERFRNQPVKKDSAKTMGLAIIIGGVIFLFVISGVMYYFLFSKPKAVVAPERQTTVQNSVPNVPAENQTITTERNATSSVLSTLPTENETATSTVATSTPEQTEAAATLSYSLGADSDGDGLFDKEEILLGTSTSTPDSDGDSYSDGAEVLNKYDPAGPGKLTANPGIGVYENKTFNYSLLYPKSWQVTTNGGDDSVMFNTGDNQFIQAIVQPNAGGQTLDAWYLEQLNVPEVDAGNRLSGTGWQGLKSPDGLTVYLMDDTGKFIFSLSYNTGGGQVMDYFNIFQLAIKSFILKE